MKIAFPLLLLVSVSCANLPQEQKSKIKKLTKIWPSCKYVGSYNGVSGWGPGDAENIALIKALNNGANRYVVIDKVDNVFGNHSIALNGYSCAETAGLSEAELEKGCFQDKSEIFCNELSGLQYSQNKSRKEVIKTACFAGLKKNTCLNVKNHYKTIDIKQKLISECNKNKGNSCYRFAKGSYQEGYMKDAEKYSALACINGSNKGCKLKEIIQKDKINSYQMKNLEMQRQNQQYMMNREIARDRREANQQFQKSLNEFSNSITPKKKEVKKYNCKSKSYGRNYGVETNTECEEN